MSHESTPERDALASASAASEGPEPLRYSPLPPGSKLTNTEAREIVAVLQQWVGQFAHPDARALDAALRDIERLFVAVWTNIDETLTRLSLVNADPAHAEEHMAVAQRYLHRWQDRGGRTGNAELVTWYDVPAS